MGIILYTYSNNSFFTLDTCFISLGLGMFKLSLHLFKLMNANYRLLISTTLSVSKYFHSGYCPVFKYFVCFRLSSNILFKVMSFTFQGIHTIVCRNYRIFISTTLSLCSYFFALLPSFSLCALYCPSLPYKFNISTTLRLLQHFCQPQVNLWPICPVKGHRRPSPAPVKHKGYATASVEVKGQCKIYESQVINNGNAIYNATRVAIVDDVCYT